MAAKNTESRKNQTSQKKQKQQVPEKRSLLYIFKSDTFRFLSGAAMILLALYLVFAMGSFFIHGGQDQSIVISDKSDMELLQSAMPDNHIINAQTTNHQTVKNNSGERGASIAEYIINNMFGFASFFIPLFLLVCGANLMCINKQSKLKWFAGCMFLLIWCSIAFSMSLDWAFTNSFISPGGKHGIVASEYLLKNIGMAGTVLILIFTMLIYVVCICPSAKEWIRIYLTTKWQEKIAERRERRRLRRLEKKALKEEKKKIKAAAPAPVPVQTEPDKSDNTVKDTETVEDQDNSEWTEISTDEISQPDLSDNSSEMDSKPEPKPTRAAKEKATDAGNDVTFNVEAAKTEETVKALPPFNPRLDLSHYKFPTLELVNKSNVQGPTIDNDEQTANKERIIHTLRNFDIEITHIDATVGPTITLYEITPAPGVRIAKIRNLEDDICMTLAATGIRIIAPIPGKGTIGIEVPNKNPQTVSIYELLCSKKFAETKYELPVAIGKTITNEIYMFDLAKLPHLLVAGATGQGKSVGLNVILTSLLYKKHPAELKIVLVDPKMVEFSIYSPIEKHFLAKIPDEKDAIITDVNKVVRTLNSLCILMDSRYELLKDANVREIKEYNRLYNSRQLNPNRGHHFMPYIVVVIDEYGDLIMTAGKEIEIPIARIAQKARAVGIHMIIATQRPSANIITGMIKTNFPARIAFKVSQMIDSRTIIDRTGAQRLVGRGDMLMLGNSGETERIQCAFVDTPEVNNICSYIHSQQGYTEAYALPDVEESSADGSSLGSGNDISSQSLDSLFREAAELVVQTGQGSTSNIQRRFQVGYNRAGRIMDQLEKAGIVGPVDGSKPRQVLCASDLELQEVFTRLGI